MTGENLPLLMRELRRSVKESNRDSTVVQKKRGASIFRAGDRGRFMFIVIEGAVEIKSKGSLLTTARAGDIFGEMALIHPDSRRTADAVAKEESELIPIHQQRLLQIIQREPEVAIELLSLFISRLTAANQKKENGGLEGLITDE